jgi:hypothetical protein
MLFNSKRGKELVRTWSHEATNAPPERKLNFLYLANDCLQQAKSKNKSDAFLGPFHRHLPEVLAHIGQVTNSASTSHRLPFRPHPFSLCAFTAHIAMHSASLTVRCEQSCKHIPKTTDSVRRTVKIWEERQVYDSKTVAAFLAALVHPPSCRVALGTRPAPRAAPDPCNRVQSGDGGVAAPAGGGSGAPGGLGGGSARLGAPALKGPAADLAAKLGAVQRLAAQCRAVRDQARPRPPRAGATSVPRQHRLTGARGPAPPPLPHMDAACPVSTGGGTRRVRLVRGRGGGQPPSQSGGGPLLAVHG